MVGPVNEYRRGFLQVAEPHIEADIGLIVSVSPHRGFPGGALNGSFVIDPLHIGEDPLDQSLEHVQDIFLFDEAHLAIDLRELRLTIGPQVLVTEAFYDLIVSVVSADHQQLLEGLRGLRQGVELTAVHARGHDEIARTFGS